MTKLYLNECPACEYVMSFANNDWYICDQTVSCRYGDHPMDYISVPIVDLDDNATGMLCQAKVVYQYYQEKKKAHQIPRLQQ